jgi:hypothetical protein
LHEFFRALSHAVIDKIHGCAIGMHNAGRHIVTIIGDGAIQGIGSIGEIRGNLGRS